MKKALLISVSGEGHINPTIALVNELVGRGDEIVFYSSENFRNRIEKTGAQYRPISKEAQQKLQEAAAVSAANPVEYLLQFLSAMEMITEAILDEISGETYDYMLYDAQTLPGIWIAHRRGLPSVATWTTFAYSLDADVNRELTGPDDAKRKQESRAMLEAFFSMEAIANRRRQLEHQYGVPLQGNFLLCPGYGDLNIVFTSALFQRNSGMMGDRFVFAGSSIRESETNDFPFAELDGNKVILISMGTIVNKQVELYRKCFEAFNDWDAKIVLSIGNGLKIEELGDIPGNFIVRNYIPQTEILKRTDAFITHAGMNSTSEALYHNVPLVMVPLINDQPSIAQRVKELGAGVILDIQSITAEALQNAVKEVMDNPGYQEKAAIISQSFRDAGGYAKAADRIMALTQR